MTDLRFADYFLFTQHSLDTFYKCPLKFKKRYMENLKWDSFPDDEVKKSLELGSNFHLLAYRYFMGIDTGLTEDIEGFLELRNWMEALMQTFPKVKGHSYYPEHKIRMSRDLLRLEANIDLIVIKGDNIDIWDWKTHGNSKAKKAKREAAVSLKHKESLQTIVYMFVLMEQCERLFGRKFEPGNIRMCYWQPDPPLVLTEIIYGSSMHGNFKEILEEKIKGILSYDYKTFDKSLFQKSCKYCEFNWFCNNERVDFEAVKEDEDFLEELDWEGIEELT